jgi:hypothetical protein
MERLDLIRQAKSYFSAVDALAVRRLLDDLLSAIAYCRDAGNSQLYIATNAPDYIIKKALSQIDLTKIGLSINFFDNEVDARIAAAKNNAFLAILENSYD